MGVGVLLLFYRSHPWPGRLGRVHVGRETNYGPRYKLFALKVPRYSRVGASATGVMVGKSGGRYVVSATMRGTAAATSGIKPGDIVTEMDVEQIGRPNKRIIYPVGLAVLGLVVGLQLARRRRDLPPLRRLTRQQHEARKIMLFVDRIAQPRRR